MSVAELGKVSHYKIERLQPGLYCIGGENFPDLPAIIEFYKVWVPHWLPLGLLLLTP